MPKRPDGIADSSDFAAAYVRSSADGHAGGDGHAFANSPTDRHADADAESYCNSDATTRADCDSDPGACSNSDSCTGRHANTGADGHAYP